MHIDLVNDKEQIYKSLQGIKDLLDQTEDLLIKSLDKEDTLICFIDVINGFVGQGVYSNPLANGIMDTIERLSGSEIEKLAFADAHTEESLEFEAHPMHAVSGTNESELHDSIRGKVDKVFEKDSINGFFAEGFKDYFDGKKDIKNIVVVGLVTDICVLNFCLTLKSYCNQMGRPLDVHVPISGVESFNLDNIHSATLMNLVSASMMIGNGIKLYKAAI